MIEYEENKELMAAIEDMLADKSLVEFNPIRENKSVRIYSLMCIRTDTKGDHVEGKGAPIVCRKLPPPIQELIGGQFLIIADYYFWNHTDAVKQKASLFHALMHINVEKGEKDELKIGTRKPEVQVFCSEISRFGAHNEVLLDFREAFKQSAKQFAENQKPKP